MFIFESPDLLRKECNIKTVNCVFMTFKGMNENVKNLQSVLIFKAG